MTRNRRHPFGVLINEVSAMGDEFGALIGRLSGQPEAMAFPLNVWQDDNAVHVDGDQLSIKAQRPAPAAADGVTWLRQERPAGHFARALVLPLPVDAEKVEAS